MKNKTGQPHLSLSSHTGLQTHMAESNYVDRENIVPHILAADILI